MFLHILFVVFFGFLSVASAQSSQWGTGMWGGMQSCGTSAKAGAGSSSELDAVRDAQTAKQEAERKLREKERALKKVDNELSRARESIESAIDSSHADFLFTHMDTGRTCEEYKCDFEGTAGPCPPSRNTPNAATSEILSYTQEEWIRVCSPNRSGGVNGAVACSIARNPDGDRRLQSGCSRSMDVYAKKSGEKRRLEGEIARLKNSIEDFEENIQTAKEDILEKLREKQRGQTEGGICIECMGNNGQGGGQSGRGTGGTDWANVLSNVGVGLLGVYMGYQTNKMVAENNSAMGWPTQNYPSWSYGFPYLMNGLYGALGGGTGQGAFGCSGGMGGTGNWNGAAGMMGPFGQGGMYSMGGGGAFGYPNGMMGAMMGGGMYNQGMGPWGMSGPNGGMNSLYGMMGMMMSGGMGMASPYGAMGGYGMMMNSYGAMGGYGMMNPYGAVGGYGMMNSYGAMGGYGMMTSYGTMTPYGMMTGGMMNGYGGMMSYGAMMSSGAMMGQGDLQYQQQMMQIQMQQYQLQVEMQQRNSQNTLQRQQASTQLQQEISSLMMRLQTIQYGGSYTGTYNYNLTGATSTGTTYYGTGR